MRSDRARLKDLLFLNETTFERWQETYCKAKDQQPTTND